MRQRSFAGPIILIAIGAIFLINNIVPDLSVWQLLADWWPLLLIGFGLIRLAEILVAYFSGYSASQAGAPYAPAPGRPIGFGWIFAIVLIGIAISLPHHVNKNWNWGPLRTSSIDIFGEEYTYPTTRVTPANGAKRLVLDNLRGNLSVTGADANEVRVEGQELIHAFKKQAADAVNEETRIELVPDGETIFVRQTEPANPDQAKVSVELEITVPKGMSIEARGKSGDLTINSIDGSVDVSSQRGEIHLKDIGGDSKLDVEHADLIHGTDLKGAIEIDGKGRDIQLENVAGEVTITGDFSGSLEFRNLAQQVHFESDQTDLKMAKLAGTMNMDLRDLRVENFTGPVVFSTHSRDVHFEKFNGPVSVELAHGDIDLTPSESQKLSKIDVHSRDGNIEVALPPNAQFALNAKTDQGDANNDYGDGIVSGTEGKGNSLRSENAGGPDVTLSTGRGTITVRKHD